MTIEDVLEFLRQQIEATSLERERLEAPTDEMLQYAETVELQHIIGACRAYNKVYDYVLDNPDVCECPQCHIITTDLTTISDHGMCQDCLGLWKFGHDAEEE